MFNVIIWKHLLQFVLFNDLTQKKIAGGPKSRENEFRFDYNNFQAILLTWIWTIMTENKPFAFWRFNWTMVDDGQWNGTKMESIWAVKSGNGILNWAKDRCSLSFQQNGRIYYAVLFFRPIVNKNVELFNCLPSDFCATFMWRMAVPIVRQKQILNYINWFSYSMV